MYYFFALAAGVLISLMAVFNGRLTAEAGLCLTTAIIHVVAIIFALIILWIKKESFIPKQKLPLWMYCGGLISVACTLCSNYAFGKISLIAITALGLLAQMLTSLVIDCLGLLGAEKRRVLPVTWACIAFSFCGIVYMLYGSELSVFSAIGSGELAALPEKLTGVPMWAYLGGIIGVLIIVITNVVLRKLSTFQVSLLLFVGQVFSSAAIDIFMGTDSSGRVFYGGVLVAAGILLNTIFEKNTRKHCRT